MRPARSATALQAG